MSILTKNKGIINFSKQVALLVLLITIPSVNQWSELTIGNTYLWWLIYSIFLFYFFIGKKIVFSNYDKRNLKILYILLIYNSLCILSGFFVFNNYWELKSLIQAGFYLLLPASIFITTNKEIVHKVISLWVKISLPLFIVFAFVLQTTAYGTYLIPISFLMLFLPLFNRKWTLIVVIIVLFVIFVDFTARSNVLKFVIPTLLACLYYINSFIREKLVRILRLFFLCAPIFFFILGFTGMFNLFKIGDFIKNEFVVKKQMGNVVVNESLIVDTRTALYTEVIESAIKNKYVMFGRTPAKGNDSDLFGDFSYFQLKLKNYQRFSNEVSILNHFTWTGLFGVILYFLIFVKSSYLGIYKSNNAYMKVVGLYIAFRWFMAWIEDFSRFDLSNIFLWIFIGMCFSSSFRAMSDIEFKLWVRGIFKHRTNNLALRQKKFFSR